MNRAAITEEQAKLDTVLHFIQHELNHSYNHIPGDSLMRRRLKAWKNDYRALLEKARVKPFFGRIDWHDAQEGPETYYIGFECLASQKIFAWQDTLVGDMFYRRASNDHITVREKRYIEIENQRVIDVRHDRFIPQDQAYTDAYLQELLNRASTPQMHNIVSTIQAEQFDIISADHAQRLVVQGAPGSGKSVVALHRISYLAYHEKIDPATTLILAPTPLFLNYISNVLPDLGNRDVQHRTYDTWVQDLLGEKLNYLPQETSLEYLLDPEQPRHEKYITYQTAKIKGSMRMAGLLERYVEILREDMRSKLEPLTIDISSIKGLTLAPEIILGKAQLEYFFDQTSDLSLNQQRAEIELRIVKHLLNSNRLTLTREQKDLFETLIAKVVHKHFDWWKALNVAVGYRRLFRNRDYLYAASNHLNWTIEELELLHHSAPKQTTPFQFADLPGLLYFQQLINGLQAAYSHIVVDEAQDVSPLFLHMLAQCCGDSMTLLGDVHQGIFEHQGLRQWEDIVAPEQIKYLTQSYRSTPEIVAQANRLLKRVTGHDVASATAIKRSGVDVKIKSSRTKVMQIHEIMNLLRTVPDHSVAILLPNVRECQQTYKYLTKHGFKSTLIENRETTYQGGHVVMPIGLSKGLEFDIVLLPHVDKDTYPPDRMYARLLYVAMTRAAKELCLWYSHEISPLLDGYLPKLEPLLAGILEEPALTVHEYTQRTPDLSVDEILLSLARKKILGLLQHGRVAPALLEALALEDKAPVQEDEAEHKAIEPPAQAHITPVPKARSRPPLQRYHYTYSELSAKLNVINKQHPHQLFGIKLVYILLKDLIESLKIHETSPTISNHIQMALGLIYLLDRIETDPDFKLNHHVTEEQVYRFAGSGLGATIATKIKNLDSLRYVGQSIRTKGYFIHPEWVALFIRYALGFKVIAFDQRIAQIMPTLERSLITEVSMEARA